MQLLNFAIHVASHMVLKNKIFFEQSFLQLLKVTAQVALELKESENKDKIIKIIKQIYPFIFLKYFFYNFNIILLFINY